MILNTSAWFLIFIDTSVQVLTHAPDVHFDVNFSDSTKVLIKIGPSSLNFIQFEFQFQVLLRVDDYRAGLGMHMGLN